MGVENIGFMLERLGRDCDDLQFLRELIAVIPDQSLIPNLYLTVIASRRGSWNSIMRLHIEHCMCSCCG